MDLFGEKTEIYIKLLNEGSICYRPAEAIEIKAGIYKILLSTWYDPEDEDWEFKPEAFVRCEKRKLSAGEVLVAISEA